MPRVSLIKIRNGIESEWLSENPVLSGGEPGFSIDTNTLKIGDGEKRWNILPPIAGGSGTGIVPSQAYKNYITINNDYLASESDDVIFVDTQISEVSLSVPDANGLGGKELFIKKLTGNNRLIVSASGSQKIDGNSDIFINHNYQSINIISNNENWFIL